jgi:hypothetical protein
MSFLRPGDIDKVLEPGEMACIPDWIMRGYPIANYPNLIVRLLLRDLL